MDFLKQLRQMGWSNKKIAVELGVSVFLVIKWFNGQRVIGPSPQKLMGVMRSLMILNPLLFSMLFQKNVESND